MVLTCMKMYAEAYLELNQTSMGKLLCEIHERDLFWMFYRFLNTPLIYVLQ